MPRTRSPAKAGLPDNLYESGGYYTWRHPATKKRYGLGRNQEDAVAQALEANAALLPAPKLAERVDVAPVPAHRSLADFLPIYLTYIGTVQLAKRSRYSRLSNLRAIEKALSSIPIGIRYEDAPNMTAACAGFLDSYVKADKRRQAKVLRSTLIDVFACMVSKGWLAVNPVKDIKLPAPRVKRQRLTLEDFWRIHEKACPWLQRGMELALVTVQRLEEVSAMTFRAAQDGRLHVVQRKTGARLRIPIGMRLGCVGLSLADVIARCRDLVVSSHLVHHVEHHGRAKPGLKVHPQTLSKAFTEAVRCAGVAVEAGRTPPTFHELRSLGIRLYEAGGYDPQNLAGHKDSATTALYRDDRGREWIDVRINNG